MLMKKLMNLNLIIRAIIICSMFSGATIFAANDDLGPWSVMLYRGGTAKQSFGEAITGHYSSFGETIYVAEVAYTLDQSNLIRRFFKPVFDTVQVAGNLAYRHDYRRHDNVKEGNLYLVWRWTKFPWERYLSNSLAVGDGVSYDSHPPFANIETNMPASDYSKLLNYLMLEATFALPSNPELQLVFRVHHSCTAWGTFPKKANAGSTNIGLGIRYYF